MHVRTRTTLILEQMGTEVQGGTDRFATEQPSICEKIEAVLPLAKGDATSRMSSFETQEKFK